MICFVFLLGQLLYLILHRTRRYWLDLNPFECEQVQTVTLLVRYKSFHSIKVILGERT